LPNQCLFTLIFDFNNAIQIHCTFSLYQRLTLDVIGRCAFGLQTNAQTDTDDDFLKNIRFLFDGLSKTFIQPLVSKYFVYKSEYNCS